MFWFVRLKTNVLFTIVICIVIWKSNFKYYYSLKRSWIGVSFTLRIISLMVVMRSSLNIHIHVNKHKSNVGQGNVGENKIIWIHLVKLFYENVTCLFIAKYMNFMICDRITHILTEFHCKEKKIWGDVCVRKIIKHRWQVKIEKSQTPSGRISRSSLVRERLKSYPWLSEISRSWPVTGVRFY